MPSVSLILVLDFDGTVTRKDIGDGSVQPLRTPRNGATSTTRGCATRSRSPMRSGRCGDSLAARATRRSPVAVKWVRCGAGLDQFLDAAAGAGGRLWLVFLGGFDFYIEAIWENARRERAGVLSIARVSSSSGWSSTFIRASAGDKCAVQQRARVRAGRATEGARVVFVGDGASDPVAPSAKRIWCARSRARCWRAAGAERGVEHRIVLGFPRAARHLLDLACTCVASASVARAGVGGEASAFVDATVLVGIGVAGEAGRAAGIVGVVRSRTTGVGSRTICRCCKTGPRRKSG